MIFVTKTMYVCMCVCCVFFFPSILDIKFVGRTSRGHTPSFYCSVLVVKYTVLYCSILDLCTFNMPTSYQ